MLKLLREAYGSGGSATTVPRTSTPSNTGTGTGSTTAALRAVQVYQATAAAAFRNLDKQLATYLIGLAGTHAVDQNALHQLLIELDTALAKLGPNAFSAAGQQRVHTLLAAALQRGQTLVGTTHATAAETAAAIDQLTAQYLYNLSGRNHPGLSVTGASPSGPGQRAVDAALSKLGKPYVWAAEGPNSFDCSGLTQYAARAAGVSIPRVSQDQYLLPKVAPANIRPGDLIFPAERLNGGSPTHVMMYIGNGQCVEAPRTGLTVRVVNLPDRFEATRWT